MQSFIATVLVVWARGPVVVEITAPTCQEAMLDLMSTMGPFPMALISCIMQVAV